MIFVAALRATLLRNQFLSQYDYLALILFSLKTATAGDGVEFEHL